MQGLIRQALGGICQHRPPGFEFSLDSYSELTEFYQQVDLVPS